MGLRCKRCGSEEQVKNGLMRGKQRFLCKACGLNFTDTPARGKPLAMKAVAVLLYVSGLSMNRTAKLLGVSTPTVQAWLEQFARAYAQKPEPEGPAVVIELDEMWHYLKKVPATLGLESLGSCYRAIGGLGMWRSWQDHLRAPAWAIEALAHAALCADDYAVYDVLLPVGRYYAGKDETHGIERDNARQRHWLARFRRRSIVVSKAIRMVDVSIALFARFAGNGRIGDLLSMLA
jgi:transposase-like protein